MKNIAVITGASSGMGKEFVKQLDNQGFDEIWAIALHQDHLNEITQFVKTPLRLFAWDLTKPKYFDQYRRLLKAEEPNIMWLVNAAGFGKFGSYEEIPYWESANMIELNDVALVKLTELSLRYMHPGGIIVQIASMAAFQPVPYMATYAASKAFVLSYSRALNVELKPKGISVTAVCPYWTATRFFERAKITPHEVVTKYVVMYQPGNVVAKAIKDAKKHKDVSIYGSKARSQARLIKMFSQKQVMRFWMKQQKLKKKYK